LIAAHQTLTPCAPVRDLIEDGGQRAAYEVQRIVASAREAAGAKVVGRKVGLTSKAVQAQLGVGSPDFGVLFDDMAYVTRQPIPLSRFVQPRVEAEIAFVLGRDLVYGPINASSVVSATEYVLPAIEIVDSRIANWDIELADTIADNASSGAFVLGARPTRLADVDLAAAGMRLDRKGQVLSTGAGAACLGDPVAAVVWLAQTLAGLGHPLRAGDVVLSGALGPVVPVAAGSYRAAISGLGEVTATFYVRDEE
jgi:2-keto-4-pentenoate hydratase